MVVYVPLKDNPRGVTILAVLWPMVTLSGVFLGLRIYSKLSRRRRLWWDDYLIILAWILLLVSCSTTTANCRLGFGLHFQQVPLQNLISFGLQSTISGFASVLAVAFSKTSFGITLLRLTDGWTRWLVIGLLVVLSVTHTIGALFFWVSCNPPAKTWDVMLPGECWPTSVTVNYSLFVGSFSAFCDFVLALLPWRLLLRFDMYNKEKIGVAVAMSMGVFAGIICIIKLTTIPLLYKDDFSYNSLPLVVWGFTEPALTIVAACIPMMRHLFRNLRRDDGDGNADHNHGNAPSWPLSTIARDSAGGGNPAAAARANFDSHRRKVQNGRSDDSHINRRTSSNSHRCSIISRSRRRRSTSLQERPPRDRDDGRSERSILAPGAPESSGTTSSTLGMSDGNVGGGEENASGERGTERRAYELENLKRAG